MSNLTTMPEADLRQHLADLPIDDLRAVLAGSDGADRLAGKVRRQGDALDHMNRRLASLRFALKVHEQVRGGSLTREEWTAARDALAETNPAHADRIDERPVTAAA